MARLCCRKWLREPEGVAVAGSQAQEALQGFSGARWSDLGIAGDERGDPMTNSCRQFGNQFLDWGHLVKEVGRHDFDRIRALKRFLTCEHLVDHDSEAVEIGASIDTPMRKLLRGHGVDRTMHRLFAFVLRSIGKAVAIGGSSEIDKCVVDSAAR